MNNFIIVTGIKLIKKGHEVVRGPYARVVSSESDIRPDESVWTGVLRWINSDDEGRWSAGWAGPHGLIIEDREQGAVIYDLENQIKAAESAIDIAENGYQGVLWRAATEAEIANGKAMSAIIDDLKTAYQAAIVRAHGVEQALVVSAKEAINELEKPEKEFCQWLLAGKSFSEFQLRDLELSELLLDVLDLIVTERESNGEHATAVKSAIQAIERQI